MCLQPAHNTDPRGARSPAAAPQRTPSGVPRPAARCRPGALRRVGGDAEPAGQLAAPAHRAQPALRLVADRIGGHHQQLVAAPQDRRAVRHEARAVAHHQRDRGAGAAAAARRPRRRASARRPGSPPTAGARAAVQRRRLDAEVAALAGVGQLQPSGQPAAASAPCSRVKTTTSTKTMLKIRRLSGTPATIGIVARTIGTAPRSPAQDRSACSRQAPERGERGHHRERPRQQDQDHARPPAPAPGRRPARAGLTSRPSSTNIPICASQPSPRRSPGWPAGAAAGVAQHQRGEVDREEAGRRARTRRAA